MYVGFTFKGSFIVKFIFFSVPAVCWHIWS